MVSPSVPRTVKKFASLCFKIANYLMLQKLRTVELIGRKDSRGPKRPPGRAYIFATPVKTSTSSSPLSQLRHLRDGQRGTREVIALVRLYSAFAPLNHHTLGVERHAY